MAFITVVQGVREGSQFPLSQSAKKIGRDSQCEIHLSDSETSRNHAVVEVRGGHYWIRDLGSSNGTFVNDRKVEERRLYHGDRIQIGKQTLLFFQKNKSSHNLDGEVAIVPSSHDDQSQIVGRMPVDASLVDRSVHWRDKNHSTDSPAMVGDEEDSSQSLWEIMYRVSLEVSRTLDIDQLLEQILELIFEWVQCDRGCIMLFDKDTGDLRPSCRKNRHSNSTQRMAISQTILEYVTKHGEGVLTSDAFEDDRWSTSASISAGGICEAICVPMKGRYGIVGTIYIDTTTSAGKYASRTDRFFKDDHLKLLVAIGHQAALAIEDTHYYHNVVQAERLSVMGQTIASLSHHIKNIVQGLKGGSYLVEEGIKREDLATIDKGWRICGRNHDRIEGLVMDMLTMSKDRTPVRKTIDLNELVCDVVELARSRVVDSPILIDWTPYPEPLFLNIEEEAVHRALLNLVGNAVDAVKNRDDGRVSVSIQHRQYDRGQHDRGTDCYEVDVLDNGPGIAVVDQERIFSMFESNKGSQGTGLGLPVSLKIAQEHGGTIEVQSQLGEGAKFIFRLPTADNSPLSQQPEEQDLSQTIAEG